MPCYVRETQQFLKQARIKLANDLGREPEIKEIAEAVGMPESYVGEICQAAKKMISLSSPWSESISDATISDLLPDKLQVTPEEALVCHSEKETLEKVLGTLTDREALVVKLRYGLTDGREYSLRQVGRQLGVSRERIRQIEEEALRKLRHPTRAQPLEELL